MHRLEIMNDSRVDEFGFAGLERFQDLLRLDGGVEPVVFPVICALASGACACAAPAFFAVVFHIFKSFVSLC